MLHFTNRPGVEVMCHTFSLFFFFSFLDKVVELIGGGSVINGATPSSFMNMKCPEHELQCLPNKARYFR